MATSVSEHIRFIVDRAQNLLQPAKIDLGVVEQKVSDSDDILTRIHGAVESIQEAQDFLKGLLPGNVSGRRKKRAKHDTWSACLLQLEKSMANSPAEVTDFISQRLRGAVGPSIDRGHDEEADDLIVWCFGSGSFLLQEAMRASVVETVAHYLTKGEVSRSEAGELVDLLVMAEEFNALAVGAVLEVFCVEDGIRLSTRASALANIETPWKTLLLANLVRALGALQPVGGHLQGFWKALLEDPTWARLAVPAFFGLRQCVGPASKSFLPRLARVLAGANEPEALASSIWAFMHECPGELKDNELDSLFALVEGAREKFQKATLKTLREYLREDKELERED